MRSAAPMLPVAATRTASPALDMLSIASISDGMANIHGMKRQNIPNTIAIEAITIEVTANPLPDLKFAGAALSAGA